MDLLLKLDFLGHISSSHQYLKKYATTNTGPCLFLFCFCFLYCFCCKRPVRQQRGYSYLNIFYAGIRLHNIPALSDCHCVTLGNQRVIDSCRDLAEKRDRLPRPTLIFVPNSPCLLGQVVIRLISCSLIPVLDILICHLKRKSSEIGQRTVLVFSTLIHLTVI